jgi:multiple sugar transport system substrate-binding protein
MTPIVRWTAAAFALLLFSSCARKTGPLSFAVGGAPAEIEFWEQLAGRFTESSGIATDIIRQPTDTDTRRQTLVTALRARQSDPDVFFMDVAWISQFAASEWLLPLENFFRGDTAYEQAFFGKVLSHADVYKNNLIALPIYIDAGLLYYRKDLLARHGFDSPPSTWEELAVIARAIQKRQRRSNAGFFGFVWQGAQYEGLVCTFLEFAGSNNGGIVFDNGSIVFNTPENARALRFMRDCIGSYAISPPNTFTEMKEEEVRLYFQKGGALFERNWPYAWPLHRAGDSPVREAVAIAPLPCFEGGRSVSTLGGWHVGISKYTDRRKEADAFVRFITSYEVQKMLALELGWNPGRKDVYNDAQVLQQMPHFSDLRRVFENALPRPNVPYYTQLSEVIQRHVNSAISGAVDGETALARAEEELNAVAARYTGR